MGDTFQELYGHLPCFECHAKIKAPNYVRSYSYTVLLGQKMEGPICAKCYGGDSVHMLLKALGGENYCGCDNEECGKCTELARICHNCQAKGGKMWKCGQCKAVRYCSKACQRVNVEDPQEAVQETMQETSLDPMHMYISPKPGTH